MMGELLGLAFLVALIAGVVAWYFQYKAASFEREKTFLQQRLVMEANYHKWLVEIFVPVFVRLSMPVDYQNMILARDNTGQMIRVQAPSVLSPQQMKALVVELRKEMSRKYYGGIQALSAAVKVTVDPYNVVEVSRI